MNDSFEFPLMLSIDEMYIIRSSILIACEYDPWREDQVILDKLKSLLEVHDPDNA